MAEQHVDTRTAPTVPGFGSDLREDAAAASRYFAVVTDRLRALGGPDSRTDEARAEADAIKSMARTVREAFLRNHAGAIYDELTSNRSAFKRMSDLVYEAADRYPGLLPTRQEIAAERAHKRQYYKEGREIDQGLFLAHVLVDRERGLHLIKAMLRPKAESIARLPEFQNTGFLDLGSATVERRGNIGHVTLTNQEFLNAEDDAGSQALETAVDLVLLDDGIEAGVLRGSEIEQGKYAGRRVFNAGINLTHLYFGQISYVEFLLEREVGLLSKIQRGLWTDDSHYEDLEDYLEKPWLAAVEAFAIGGGCQLLCVVDRVIAEPDAYFSLPASKEGFMPGAANLRFPRLVGIHLARQGIFFERKFHADTQEGMMICDETVEPAGMDEAIERNAQGLLTAGFTSAVSNRKGLRIGQESLDTYRRYAATYCRQQALCVYDAALIRNLEKNWQPSRRKM